MKIKMLKSIQGAVNGGLSVKLFKEGLIYDTNPKVDELTSNGISEELADVFLNQLRNTAEKYSTPQAVIQKMIKSAPQNKVEEIETLDFSKPESKEETVIDKDFFKDMKAGEVRKYAQENGVDLSYMPANSSAAKLAKEYLKRKS